MFGDYFTNITLKCVFKSIENIKMKAFCTRGKYYKNNNLNGMHKGLIALKMINLLIKR